MSRHGRQWLKGYAEAYKFSTQPTDAQYDPNEDNLLWQSTDSGFDADNAFRNRLAHYFLPSANEWYKSAYYDPLLNHGLGGYWDFPYACNIEADCRNNAVVVYARGMDQGPANVALAGSLSPYGTMAQGGNVWEWEETERDLVNDSSRRLRGARGGGWFDNGEHRRDLSALSRYAISPARKTGLYYLGFRVAAVPEPTTAWLTVVGSICLLRSIKVCRCVEVGERVS